MLFTAEQLRAAMTVQGMYPRAHAVVFPKKGGKNLLEAQDRVNEVYPGTYARAAAAPPGSGRARAAGRCLHLTYHHLPRAGGGEDAGRVPLGWATGIRLGVVSVASACWLLCYPRFGVQKYLYIIALT